jgi:hypothetical protein
MSRAAYCREQARLCRDAAAQVGLQRDASRLREIATAYEAEADSLECVRQQQQQQQPPQD